MPVARTEVAESATAGTARRVLVIAYYFPPLGGVGVQRTLKYVKYLPENGWQPVVITPARPAYTVRDATLLNELQADLQVERTGSFEPARLPAAVEAFLSRRRLASSATDAHVGQATTSLPARLLTKSMILWNRVWAPFLFPDAAVGWVGAASKRGLQVHKRAPVDAIYSTSGPVSCHLVARKIAARTGLPWIADFRDPWIGNAFNSKPRGLNAYRQRRMESGIVAWADRLIFPTQGVMKAYAERYPLASAKMLVIPNGYDVADFPSPVGPVRTGKSGTDGEVASRRFRLVYAGSLYGEQELEIFLKGLEQVAARRPDIKDRLDVEFVGWLTAANRRLAAGYADSNRLGSMVRFSGFVPHAEAIRKEAEADGLLQIIADDPRKGEVQGGKLMEYLGLDKQILAIVPEGVAREVLRELDWGILADPTPDGVAVGIERLIDEPPPTRRADPEGRYDRVNLAARLAAYLDDAVAAGRSARGAGPPPAGEPR
ncbi:MAG: glycosyltransferase [Candidatus Limnocylindrales bacterium]|jgi:glycosyltransferase involved in cell wall biosynthesis